MSRQHESQRGGEAPARLAVDRIACAGKGICASIVPESIELDEWGYPIVRRPPADHHAGEIAIRLCPARALSWAKMADPSVTGRAGRAGASTG